MVYLTFPACSPLRLRARGKTTLRFRSFGTSQQDLQTSSPPPPLQTPPRLRFAPSPTGDLHLGGLRTALFNHLFARRHGGKWILRIEDTDQKRLVPNSAEAIQEMLSWAGLQYDEGPDVGGDCGPYVQSQRLPIYTSYAEHLLASGKAYRDFRPPSQETTIPGAARRVKALYVPPGEAEARELMAQGTPHVVRLRTEPKDVTLHDLVYGDLHFKADVGADDPVLIKSDGWPTYHLASIVDDSEMHITHVLRGEEWLPSVPIHLAIYEALALRPPAFAHLPLLINPDGSKLSKRAGNADVKGYREMGYEPEALVNFVALTGYNHKGTIDVSTDKGKKQEYEVFSMRQLVDNFEIGRISPSKAALAEKKLRFLNSRHIKAKIQAGMLAHPLEQLRGRFQALYGESAPSLVKDDDYLATVIDVLKGQVELIPTIPERASPFFVDRSPPSLATLGVKGKDAAQHLEDVTSALSRAQAALERLEDGAFRDAERVRLALVDAANVGVEKEDKDCHAKNSTRIMKALRAALADGQPGAKVYDIMAVLGRVESMKRIGRTVECVRAEGGKVGV